MYGTLKKVKELNIRKFKNTSIFKSNTLKLIWPKPNSVYCFHNCKGIRLKTRLSLGLTHLREKKIKYSFQECLNLLSFCCNNIETSFHYLRHDPTQTKKLWPYWTKLKVLTVAFYN